MCPNDGLPDGGTPPRPPAHGCRTCGELRLAEAVANAQRDHSRATDCRVLLRRHRAATGCADVTVRGEGVGRVSGTVRADGATGGGADGGYGTARAADRPARGAV
ncbi:hypothetical protein GCM10023082_54360 [Streptomyces tremellae]|uniref:Uncharacterized protein n=1 Tax=Streptomyces tremellae TaxID=1124239 RepID=A0ABP7FYF9_9ACTN